LNLARNIQGNKKSFYRCIGDKRKPRENMGLLWKETGDLVTQNVEKAEVCNNFLPQSSLSDAPATPPKSQKAKAGTRRMKK